MTRLALLTSIAGAPEEVETNGEISTVGATIFHHQLSMLHYLPKKGKMARLALGEGRIWIRSNSYRRRPDCLR